MHELKACGVLIVRGDPITEFLLMRHADRWDLPKGHLDPGETETECALRELAEETGLSDADVDLDPGFRFETKYNVRTDRTGGEWWPKTLVIFLGRLNRDSEITLTEHLGYEWFSWKPPHKIQQQTIDPVLATLEKHLSSRSA